MRALVATFVLALLLAGCQGTGSGMFGQLTLPPLGTQPPGTLVAGSNYYPTDPAANSASPSITQPADKKTEPIGSVPSLSAVASNSRTFQPAGNQITERRGATLTRTNLAASARTTSTGSPEEPIRIPNESTVAGGLAAVIPIRGIPTTDATGLFEAVRSQLAPAANLAPRAPLSSSLIEITQLPDASPTARQAALSRQSLR